MVFEKRRHHEDEIISLEKMERKEKRNTNDYEIF